MSHILEQDRQYKRPFQALLAAYDDAQHTSPRKQDRWFNDAAG
jgi:hypothetical protein